MDAKDLPASRAALRSARSDFELSDNFGGRGIS
jgi:hypothetical protein